jgi:ABC-type multidrug transport system permease subunit
MVALRPDIVAFLKFILVLILFNMTAASLCFAIAIIFKDLAVANIIATMIMLFQMLFGGLLLNKTSIPISFAFLDKLSFFKYAFEALVVNEVATLWVEENKYGLQINVFFFEIYRFLELLF